MSFTSTEVLLEVRDQIFDSLEPTRYSDAFILRKMNQALRRMVTLRPDLFTEIDTITCVNGTLQSAPTDSVRLMDVLGNTTGGVVKEINQEVLDLMAPAWESTSAGPATNWMRYQRSPNQFYVYPPANTSQTLQLAYAACPPVYAIDETITLQDAYMPVVIDGTCWLMESLDAEHVESGRAVMFKEMFMSALAGGLAARRITDTETAAAPREEAV